MSRTARNIAADIPYHVIHRGNNRQKIFFCDSDYSHFLSLMLEAKKKHPCKIYAYVLMSNHVHFLVESVKDSDNLAKFIKLVVQKYSQHVNRSQKRTGTLWEGRFRSSPVSKDSYLLACARYIELNPVRAKIVEEPDDYPWSSYRFKAGDTGTCQLVDNDQLYIGMGKDESERQINYKKWIKEKSSQEEWETIRRAAHKGGVFGNNQFKNTLEKRLCKSFEIRDKGRPKKAEK